MEDKTKPAPPAPKILIVEDETSMLRALVDQFKREGFETFEATDGSQGLQLALENEPDLILLDIVMPRMDGLTMLKTLRTENEYGRSVPVILLTNLSADSDEIVKTIIETKPAYYLVKTNWTLRQVVEKVRDRLTRK